MDFSTIVMCFQVPSNSHNSTGPITLPSVSGLEISRRSMSSTDSGSQALVPVSIPSDSLGSNVQGPDSPQGIYLFFFSK